MKSVNSFFAHIVLFSCVFFASSASAKESWKCQGVKGDPTGGMIKICFTSGQLIGGNIRLQHWDFINASDQSVTFDYGVYGKVNGGNRRIAYRKAFTLPAHSNLVSTNGDQMFGADELVSAEIYPPNTQASVAETSQPAKPKPNWCMSEVEVMIGSCECIPNTIPSMDLKARKMVCVRRKKFNPDTGMATNAKAKPSPCDPAVTSCVGQPPKQEVRQSDPVVLTSASHPAPARRSMVRRITGFYR